MRRDKPPFTATRAQVYESVYNTYESLKEKFEKEEKENEEQEEIEKFEKEIEVLSAMTQQVELQCFVTALNSQTVVYDEIDEVVDTSPRTISDPHEKKVKLHRIRNSHLRHKERLLKKAAYDKLIREKNERMKGTNYEKWNDIEIETPRTTSPNHSPISARDLLLQEAPWIEHHHGLGYGTKVNEAWQSIIDGHKTSMTTRASKSRERPPTGAEIRRMKKISKLMTNTAR